MWNSSDAFGSEWLFLDSGGHGWRRRWSEKDTI